MKSKRGIKMREAQILFHLTRPKSKTCLALLLVNGEKGDFLLVESDRLAFHKTLHKLKLFRITERLSLKIQLFKNKVAY